MTNSSYKDTNRAESFQTENVMKTPLVVVLLTGLIVVAVVATAPTASKNAPEKDLRAFGVVGDGQADDTAALQKAVDAGVGGVHFPKGVYRLSRPIVIDLDKTGFTSFTGDGTAQLLMAGPGPALRFVGTHAGTA